ncbi:MAG: amino acid ABC transporter permease [Anaerolineae bacterium]
MAADTEAATPGTTQVNIIERLAHLPWWLLLILLAGVILFYNITTDELYSVIFGRLAQGIGTTLFVAIVSYIAALVIGLIVALGRVSKNPITYNLATLYVNVIRGVPILVQIFYVAFVIGPAIISLLNGVGNGLAGVLGPNNALAKATTQDISMLARVMIALAIAYGGFEAETFRAGIESIGRGQMEAARSLGMSYFQAMRHIILPQAFRRVLPPLGNDFISMIKDSSLVSVLGVRDITQEGRLYAAASFRFPETYNTLAFLYLAITFTLSLGVKFIENRLSKGGKGS